MTVLYHRCTCAMGIHEAGRGDSRAVYLILFYKPDSTFHCSQEHTHTFKGVYNWAASVMPFVSLFIGASVDHNPEEKPSGESYRETGNEVKKDEKPVPVASYNEGMLKLFIFSLTNINFHFSALG